MFEDFAIEVPAFDSEPAGHHSDFRILLAAAVSKGRNIAEAITKNGTERLATHITRVDGWVDEVAYCDDALRFSLTGAFMASIHIFLGNIDSFSREDLFKILDCSALAQQELTKAFLSLPRSAIITLTQLKPRRYDPRWYFLKGKGNNDWLGVLRGAMSAARVIHGFRQHRRVRIFFSTVEIDIKSKVDLFIYDPRIGYWLGIQIKSSVSQRTEGFIVNDRTTCLAEECEDSRLELFRKTRNGVYWLGHNYNLYIVPAFVQVQTTNRLRSLECDGMKGVIDHLLLQLPNYRG